MKNTLIIHKQKNQEDRFKKRVIFFFLSFVAWFNIDLKKKKENIFLTDNIRHIYLCKYRYILHVYESQL